MTTRTERSTVVGVFHERDDARDAIEALKDAGFDADRISILSPDKQETRALADETGTHAGSGAATGAVAGGILGGIGGWLVGIGALAIPGVGPFIAAGAFATALGGAAIGAGVGAIAGALVGMGVPKEEADYYEGEVKTGRTLVTVGADGRYDEARSILRQHGAYDVEDQTPNREAARAAMTADTTPVPSPGHEGNLLRLREEELRANKETVQTGEVGVSKDVVTEQRTLDVPVTREEVYVDRHPVDRRPADRPIEERGETIDVPVHEEQVTLEKQPVVYEEVEVNKRPVQETQQVSGTVRREEARIEQEGTPVLAGAGYQTTAASDWNTEMPAYRSQWQQRYGQTGGRWEDAEPAYHYGYDLRSQPTYRGRDWSQIEPDVRRDWETSHPNTPWERAKEGIRSAWERVS